jgi:hypothetical protein
MVPWLELLYPAADSEDNAGVLMTNHVARSRPFFMSSVNFFATRLAIAGIEKAKRRENQGSPCFRTGTVGEYHANHYRTILIVSIPTFVKTEGGAVPAYVTLMIASFSDQSFKSENGRSSTTKFLGP